MPNNANKSNKEAPPAPDTAAAYERAYHLLFNKLSKPLQDRVLAVKANNDLKDVVVNDFLKSVIAMAEDIK
jgi:hypothetical protein